MTEVNRDGVEFSEWFVAIWAFVTIGLVFLVLICYIKSEGDVVDSSRIQELEELEVDHAELKQACIDRGFAKYRVRDWGVGYFELAPGNGLSGPYNRKKMERYPPHLQQNLKKDAQINQLKDRIKELTKKE